MDPQVVQAKDATIIQRKSNIDSIVRSEPGAEPTAATPNYSDCRLRTCMPEISCPCQSMSMIVSLMPTYVSCAITVGLETEHDVMGWTSPISWTVSVLWDQSTRSGEPEMVNPDLAPAFQVPL